MTTTQTAARFALDENAAREWIGHAIAAYEGTEGEALPEAHLPTIGEDYDPRDWDNANATGELVANARFAGIITGPGELDFCADYDMYGDHGYTWRLYLGQPAISAIVLSSPYEELRHLGAGSAAGADAALAVLREAVSDGNRVLGDLDRYVASREG